MRCYFSSRCEEPENLCCNFCSNKKCDVRCTDNHKKCKLHDKDGKIYIKEDTKHHVICKGNNSFIVFEKDEPENHSVKEDVRQKKNTNIEKEIQQHEAKSKQKRIIKNAVVSKSKKVNRKKHIKMNKQEKIVLF